MTRSSMNSSIILVTRRGRIMIWENMIKKWTALAFGKMNGFNGMKTVLQMKCSRWCRRRRAASLYLDEGWAMMKIVEQSRRALPKNLIRPLPVQDPKGERFWRLALPFAGARRSSGWIRLWWQHNSEKRQNPNLSWYILWCQPMGWIYRRATWSP